MSSCSCSPAVLTSVAFDDGTTLLRCTAHEQQRWLRDGREVESADALSALRSLFVSERTRRPTTRTPRRPRVVQLPETTRMPYDDGGYVSGDADEQLTALLQARGLTGSWAVA